MKLIQHSTGDIRTMKGGEQTRVEPTFCLVLEEKASRPIF